MNLFKNIYTSKSYLKTFFWISVSLILFHIYIYLILYFERNTPSQIKAYDDALWYALVTVTTVGYGDMYPYSPGGRILAVVLLFCSVGLIGYILGKVTNTVFIHKEQKKMGNFGTDFKHHVVIIGWDDSSKQIVRSIVNERRTVAVITPHKHHIDEIYQEFTNMYVFVLYSNLTNYTYFSKANISQASVVVMCSLNDTEKLITSINLKAQYPEPRYVVTIDDQTLFDTFKNAGVESIICKNSIASHLTASYVFEPAVAAYSIELLGSSPNIDTPDIEQYIVKPENELCSKTYGEAFSLLKQQFNTILIGIHKRIDGKYTVRKLPKDDVLIEESDYLIIITSRNQSKKLDSFFGIHQGFIG